MTQPGGRSRVKRRITKLDRKYKWLVRGFFVSLLMIWAVSFGWSHYQNLTHYQERQSQAMIRLANVYGYQGEEDPVKSLDYLDQLGLDDLPYNIRSKYWQGYNALRISPVKEGLIRFGLWALAFALIYGTFDFFLHKT